MGVELINFKRTRSVVKAVEYAGPVMDEKLHSAYKNDFRFAFDFQGGGQYLIPEKRGLKIPHSGDWLIFDESGRHLIDIMPDRIFKQVFSPVMD